jgi:hypothetical protein
LERELRRLDELGNAEARDRVELRRRSPKLAGLQPPDAPAQGFTGREMGKAAGFAARGPTLLGTEARSFDPGEALRRRRMPGFRQQDTAVQRRRAVVIAGRLGGDGFPCLAIEQASPAGPRQGVAGIDGERALKAPQTRFEPILPIVDPRHDAPNFRREGMPMQDLMQEADRLHRPPGAEVDGGVGKGFLKSERHPPTYAKVID